MGAIKTLPQISGDSPLQTVGDARLFEYVRRGSILDDFDSRVPCVALVCDEVPSDCFNCCVEARESLLSVD